jgi:hypothetical protein
MHDEPQDVRVCAACLTPLSINARERNPRKWCDEACRVWACRHPGETRNRICACGAPIARRSEKWCSRRCSELARGAEKQVYPRSARCERCGDPYQQRRSDHHVCSRKCYQAKYRKDNPEKFAEWTEAKRAAYERRRARKRGAVIGDRFTNREIFDRDGWVCQLCLGEVDARTVWPDPESASLDHAIPLAGGGDHSRENVQLAHLRCNMTKRDQMPTAA